MGDRLGKVVAFCRSSSVLGDVELHPWPWREPPVPYYLVNPRCNADGHGGYAANHAFDANGVPYRLVDGICRYDPLLVARYALKMRAIAKDGNADAAARARAVLPALVASGRTNAAWATGPTAETMTEGAVASGLVQAFVISALLRLHYDAPHPEVPDLVDRAFRKMIASPAAGGALIELGGHPQIQEHGATPTFNLGAAIDGLLACYDLAESLSHATARDMSLRLEDAIAAMLCRYRTPIGWSFYALDILHHRFLSSLHYHTYFTLRVRLLALRTGRQVFADTADEWEYALASVPRRLTAGLCKSLQVLWVRDLRQTPLPRG